MSPAEAASAPGAGAAGGGAATAAGETREAGPAGEGRSGPPAPATDRRGLGKGPLLATVVGTVLAFDLVTKAIVVRGMTLYESIPVVGDFFRLTYTHNPGAAFGIHVGEHSRLVFLGLALAALGLLLWLYRTTPRARRFRLFALALVAGGAIGNVIDRIRFERGVVDFLDVGLGSLRWPVFNVADMAVSVGAVLLLVSFYREERREGAARRAGVEDPEDDGDERGG